MKILIISSLFPPHVLGGYAILCEQVCRELLKLGDEIHVLTSNHGTDTDFVEIEGMPVERSLYHIISFKKPPGKRRHLWRRMASVSAHNYQQAQRLIAEVEPDVVFVWSQLRLTLGSALAAQDAGLPVIYALNDMYMGGYAPSTFSFNPKSWVNCLLDRVVFPHATFRKLNLNYATCISMCLKEQLQGMQVPIAHARVIYQGIPIERYAMKESPGSIGSPVKLLYVGQLLEDKGVHTLLEAVRWLNDNAPDVPVTATIVGGGPEDYGARLRTLAAENVTFKGKVPNEELPAVYRAHDIFVFPSIWREPFGLTQLEAMASGTVAVCTTDGGHGECIVDRENALAFEKGNSRELAARILELIHDEGLSRRLALNAREMVEKNYTISRYAASLREFLVQAQQENARHLPAGQASRSTA